MEIVVLTILSLFAFIGIYSMMVYILNLYKPTYADNGFKFIILSPQNSSSKLEGIVRQIFSKDIPKSLMTDGKIYFMASNQDTETIQILEKLRKMYPIEVLPEEVSYYMITER